MSEKKHICELYLNRLYFKKGMFIRWIATSHFEDCDNM